MHASTLQQMEDSNMDRAAPIVIRIFKEERTLEVWKQDRTGKFGLLQSYQICKFSGKLGPKVAVGDHQAPEGFYEITPGQLNPQSSEYLSFNIGFPNAFDRSLGRTGSFLMVHGGCASVGCFAMTDPVIDEIWRVVTAALNGGQKRFHVHVFPFRMTPENLARRREARWGAFWRELEAGYRAFEATHLPPRIGVCAGRYTVAPAAGSEAAGHEIANSCINLTGSQG